MIIRERIIGESHSKTFEKIIDLVESYFSEDYMVHFFEFINYLVQISQYYFKNKVFDFYLGYIRSYFYTIDGICKKVLIF